MYENIATVCFVNKAVPLLVVEPFNRTISQCTVLLSEMFLPQYCRTPACERYLAGFRQDCKHNQAIAKVSLKNTISER